MYIQQKDPKKDRGLSKGKDAPPSPKRLYIRVTKTVIVRYMIIYEIETFL